MITYRTNKEVDFKRLVELFTEVGWTDKTQDMNRLKTMVNNSQIVVTAWDGQMMVGFARCTTDYVFNGQINNVVVDSIYRGKGIGKSLIQRILNSSDKVTYVLRGDQDNIEFYKRMGFGEANLTLTHRRKR